MIIHPDLNVKRFIVKLLPQELDKARFGFGMSDTSGHSSALLCICLVLRCYGGDLYTRPVGFGEGFILFYFGSSHDKVNISVDMLTQKVCSVNSILRLVESTVKRESVKLTFTV